MLNALIGLWPLLLLLALVGVTYVVLRKLGLISGDRGGGPSGDDDAGYRRREHLLTKGELAFYRALQVVVGDRYVIMAKVRLADLVEVNRSGPGAAAAFNRVSAKHVDFVLCDLGTIRPVLVIELDDASHGEQRRQRADATKDRVLASAGLPMLRVRAAAAYVPHELRRQIEVATTSRISREPEHR